MYSGTILPAVFQSRPNRFIALCTLDGKTVEVHVKNTGRCRELLVPGCRVYLEHNPNPTRRTAYSLIAVEKGNLLINMDSQAPNAAVAQALQKGILPILPEPIARFTPEQTFGSSRFDFQICSEHHCGYLEVKGVTLEEKGVASFPDAPTQRGLRHVEELIRARSQGLEAAILFVIQFRPVSYFTPNDRTMPVLREVLRRADAAGVRLLAYDCQVTPDTMELCSPVEIRL